MRVPYGKAAYKRSNGNFAEIKLVNMFVETTPVGRDGVAIISRKGLLSHSSPGAGPITGLFCEPNVFSGDLFSVSGGTLYRNTTSIGAIGGSGPVSFAAGSATELAICAGGAIYRYDGATLATVTFPDTANVTAIAFHDGLYLAARALTHKWYWSAVLDADTWAALDFASAESRPDKLRDLAILGDALFLFGEGTIEMWSNTGDPDAPYSRIEGRISRQGVIATGCIVPLDNSLLFVGADGMVYRLADTPQRISDHGIEEKIAQCSAAGGTVSAFGFIDGGHSFYCLRLTAGDGAGTYPYDVSTGQWCEFATYNRANFAGRCSASSGLTVYLGDDTAGKIWTLSGWQDNLSTLERLFTIALPIDGDVLTIDNLTIVANTGWTELLTGQGSSPMAELRTSRDAGALFGDWKSAALGIRGDYATKTQWRRVGMFASPGFLGEIRCTDPVPFRVDGVFINEAGGGRSR
jgi:hypothetical protein